METGTALALPSQTDLIGLFKGENALDPIIAKLEAAARAEALTHDLSTAKGRKALRSLANTVSSKKAELDRQGKALTEAQRKEIAAVNAGRKQAEDRLAALRDEIKKPVEDWDAAEEARVAQHKQALDRFDLNRADASSTSEQVRHILHDIENVSVGKEWDEFQPIAAAKHEQALNYYRGLLTAAEQREADAAELARLRAESEARAKKDAEEAERREGDRLAAEKAEADRIEAEQAEARRAEAEKAEAARREQAERDRAAAADQARKDAEAKAEADRKAAEERYANEIADARAREIAAAQRERDRIAEEQRQAAQARAKREADQAHRKRIRDDIATSMNGFTDEATAALIADAIMTGQIGHVEVRI
jgi:hypothetical protein